MILLITSRYKNEVRHSEIPIFTKNARIYEIFMSVCQKRDVVAIRPKVEITIFAYMSVT